MEVFDLPASYSLASSVPPDELAYWIAFSRILGIGPMRFKLLLGYFQDDVEAAWKATSKELVQAGLDAKTIDGFLKQRSSIRPEQELERLERLRISAITWNDKVYPALLK